MSRRYKTPITLQMEALECGAASLSMILAYYKAFIPLEELRVQCGVSRDGTKASSLVQVAKQYGLDAHGYKMDIPSLKELKKPAIIFWNFNHFVVYEGYRGKKFYLNDPAVGHRTVEFSEFDDSFTGIVLTFEKTPDFKAIGTRPSIWRGLRKRTLGLRGTMSFFVLLSVMFFIPGIITPTFQRFFVDKILVHTSMNLLKPFIVGLAISALINGILTALQGFCLLRFQTKLSLSSTSKFVEHILKMPMEFFVQRLPGELCNRISSADIISQFISGRLVGVAINIVGSIFFFILMLLYDVTLTLIILFFTIVLCVLFLVSSNKVKNKTFKIEMESGKLGGITMSGIDLIESIKASGSENDFFQQWAGQQTVVIQETLNLFKANTANSIAPEVIRSILSILVLTMGALKIMDGDMTIGMLLAYQTLMGNFMSPVMSLVELGKEILAINADMQRIDDVMDYPAPVIFQDDQMDKGNLQGTNKGVEKNVNQTSNCEASKTQVASTQQDFEPIKKLDGYISIKNLMFKYNILTEPVIQDFNLELTPGKRVALVGGSGSGKSTLGKLLCALYRPLEGEITYDGKKLSEIPRRVFSASVAVVSQNITLFKGSVKDNLTMWDKTVPEEVYIQAAKDACIHTEIIERPEGYYTELVEGGTNFSGGQRQRLEIARALAGNPRIIIMDEATSALDPVTEQIVDQNIRRRGCTCIIIAHRLSTIRDCDEIIVLDRGRIVQRGRHNQLIQKEDGLYKRLIQNM